MNYQSWKHSDLNGLTIQEYSGNYWDDISYIKNKFLLFHILDGSGKMIINKKEIELNKNKVLFVHSQTAHSGKPDKEIGWIVRAVIMKDFF